MLPDKIRILALVIIQRNNQVLVTPGQDPITGRVFHRLVGGGVEFGETSLEALQREIREELGVSLTDYRYLGVSENIFTYNGQSGHEVCFIYSASFEDEANYQREVWPILDCLDGNAVWIDMTPENLALIKPDNAMCLLQK